MLKNTASQKLTVFAFADAGHASLDAGEPVTGDAANITLKIEQDDDGTQSASNDTNPTEVEDGQYRFDLTQAETNGDKLTFYPESSTAGVQVLALPSMVIYTRVAVPDVNVSQISGDSTAADNLEAAADGTGYNLGGGSIVAASVTADVTTDTASRTASQATGFSTHSAADVWSVGTREVTNMRGTDSAYTGTPPTAGSIADAVWDEATSGHTTSGTFGKLIR